jgi:CubicO group peptidase (beta-lactamase class C family)
MTPTTPKTEERGEMPELHELLAKRLLDENGPGCALGVVTDGHLRCVAVRGLASLEHRVPITAETVFHVASVSKHFAAYSCALLGDRGQLDLDAPLPTLLDFVAFPEVTARHLIHHVSGIRDQWELLMLSGRGLEDVITTDDIVRLVARQRDLNFEPGSSHSYSNTGYTLLGLVVEQVTGLPLKQFAATEIFEPLSMAKTQFLDDYREIVADRADSYYGQMADGFRRLALSYSTTGATSLNTTVSDLARWSMCAMTAPVRSLLERSIMLNDGSRFNYATGLMLGSHRGSATLEHSGADAGFRAHLVMFPDDAVAVIALSNYAACPVYELAYAAADLLLDERGAPPIEASGWSPRPNQVAELEGLYRNPATGAAYELGTSGEQIQIGGLALEPYKKGVFAGATDRRVELQIEPDVRLRMLATSEQRLERVARWTPDPEDLDRFQGVFWSEEIETLWRIDHGGEGLVLDAARWGPLPLTPTVCGGFTVAIPDPVFEVNAHIEFDESATELLATLDRVTRLRFGRIHLDAQQVVSQDDGD